MFGARLTSFRCASLASALAGSEAFRSTDEARFMTTVNLSLFSKTKTASVCAPTDPVLPASPTQRQGWSAGGRTVPEHMFEHSKKMPAHGFDGASKKLLTDALKEARTVNGFTYAKIGQCNEDQLRCRQDDKSMYPQHIYGRDRFRILMHGVLGRWDGRMFEWSAAKANNVLQDVRLNQQLEPLEMANHLCAITADRPIAVYVYPVREQYDGRGEHLSIDVEVYNRIVKDSKRKEPSDMQQDGEDDETHDKRLKFPNAKRNSEANKGSFGRGKTVPVDVDAEEAVAKPTQTRTLPMALFDSRKNKLLGGWSKTPSSTEHRAQLESRYLIEATQKQLGPDDGATLLNELTGPYAFHSVLRSLNKAGSGLSGFPSYNTSAHAAALHEAVKNRWLKKPTANNSSGSGSASS